MQTKYLGTATSFDGLRIHFHTSHHPNAVATFAMHLMEKALIAAADNGEDSAGRAKLRALTAAEVASKACNIAEAAFDAFHNRGWMVLVPPPTDAQVAKILGIDHE
jgi:hypothetical protein